MDLLIAFIMFMSILSLIVPLVIHLSLHRRREQNYGFGYVPNAKPSETKEQSLVRKLCEMENRALLARSAQYRAEHALWDQQFKTMHGEYPSVAVKYPSVKHLDDYTVNVDPGGSIWNNRGPGPKWFDTVSKSWTTARNDADLAKHRSGALRGATQSKTADLEAERDHWQCEQDRLRRQLDSMEDECRRLSVFPRRQLTRLDRLLDRCTEESSPGRGSGFAVSTRITYPDPSSKPKKTKSNGDPSLSNKQQR